MQESVVNEIIENEVEMTENEIVLIEETPNIPTISEPKVEQNAVTMWNNVELFENT